MDFNIVTSTYSTRIGRNETSQEAMGRLFYELIDQGIVVDDHQPFEWFVHNDRVVEIVLGAWYE